VLQLIQSCVKCLCLTVEHIVHQVNYVQEMLEYCCRALEGAAELGIPETTRYLVLIGLLCRYYDFNQAANVTAAAAASKKSTPPTKRVYTILFHHASTEVSAKHDAIVRTRAVQGLGHLFIREPAYLRHCSALLSKFLQPTASPALQAQMLQSFIEVLRDEESRAQEAEGTRVHVSW
jgi:hypothetical protein